MSRAIVITSGKGGVGKTTLTATIGRILASMNKRTVLIDTDFGLNNLDVILGVENKIVYDLIDVVENRCRVSQALIKDENEENLFILPSAHSYDKSALSGQSLRAVITSLKSRFDFVLIDSPAGIEKGFHRAVSSADEAIVVTTPHLSALRDAEKVCGLIKAYELKSVYAVLNRVRGDMVCSGDSVSATDVAMYLDIPVAGVIPESDEVNAVSLTSIGISPNGAGYEATEMLCKYLINGSGELYDASKRYRGFFGSIKRKIRKII